MTVRLAIAAFVCIAAWLWLTSEDRPETVTILTDVRSATEIENGDEFADWCRAHDYTCFRQSMDSTWSNQSSLP